MAIESVSQNIQVPPASADEAFEQGEHEPGGAGDARRDRREAELAGVLGGGDLRWERPAGGAVHGDLPVAGGEFVAVHLGVDAVAAGVGEHLEEPGRPAVLAQAAVVRVVGDPAAELLAGLDDSLEEVLASRGRRGCPLAAGPAAARVAGRGGRTAALAARWAAARRAGWRRSDPAGCTRAVGRRAVG